MADDRGDFFANRALAHFKQFISKDGVLDEAALIEAAGLNERQIPRLRELLIKNKFLKESPAAATDESAADTAPLKPRAKKEKAPSEQG